MNTTVFRQFADIDTKEIAPGFFSKLIHTANNTINFIEVKAGNSVPDHAHIHEQCFLLCLEGTIPVNRKREVRRYWMTGYVCGDPI
jgi:quercetin dioxygenase-like cupin family protein